MKQNNLINKFGRIVIFQDPAPLPDKDIFDTLLDWVTGKKD